MLREVLARASTLEYIGWIFLLSVCGLAIVGGCIEIWISYRDDIRVKLWRFIHGIDILNDYIEDEIESAKDNFTTVEDWADYKSYCETEDRLPTFSEIFGQIFNNH